MIFYFCGLIIGASGFDQTSGLFVVVIYCCIMTTAAYLEQNKIPQKR